MRRIPSGGGRGIADGSCSREKGCRECVKVLQEGDVKGVEDAPIGGIPEAIGFGVGSVPDEDARSGPLEEFGVVGGDECIGTAADFTEVGERGRAAVPKFVGSSAVNGGGRSEIGEVSSSGAKFVPEVGRRVAGKAHGMGFVEKGAVETFSTAVLCRGVRSGELVVDAMERTPFRHCVGSEFTVIGDEDFEAFTTLVFNSTVPGLEDGGGFVFTS